MNYWSPVHRYFKVLILGCCLLLDIEAQILEIQGMKAALVEGADQGVGLDSTGYYDQEIYGGSDSRFAGYVTSIAANEQEDVSDSITLLIAFKEPMSACVSTASKSFWSQLFVFQDDDEDSSTSLLGQKKPGYHAPVAILNSIPQSDEQVINRYFIFKLNL